MKWQILILTMPSRARFLARLQAVLKPQLEQVQQVEVLVEIANPQLDLGANRQNLLDRATAEYVNFVDDDDLVPHDYVATILPLLDGVDYIGFQLQMFNDGTAQLPTFHSLRYKEWNGDGKGWYRDISHLNPIRRDLAMRVRMEGGSGEDCRWANKLRQLGIVKTEHYVDKVMYLYYWRSSKNDSPVPNEPQKQQKYIANMNPKCPNCGNQSTGWAGGMRRCNQCGDSWV